MGFLSNLVGAEHIERFIPLAHADAERSVGFAPPDGAAPDTAHTAATGTREMPKFVAGIERPREPPTAAGVVRVERSSTGVPPPAPEAAPTGGDARALSAAAMHEQVIADAARLVQWGRKWYELAEIISSMADRPSLIDVRRILKDNKTVIDKKAGRG
jgi:hypothetical protein